MNIVILNGKRIRNMEEAHKYIKRKLNFPEYYGENLDALWDILSTISEPIDIKIINGDVLYEKLGSYGVNIIDTFKDAALENKNILFEII